MSLFKKHPVYQKADEVKAILSEYARIRAAIADCGSKLVGEMERFNATMRETAGKYADQYLNGGAGERSSSAELSAVERRVDELQATLAGLQRRESELHSSISRQVSEFEVQFGAWTKDRLTQFMRSEYEKAVTSFAAANRQLMAIGIAMGDEQAIRAADMAAAFSPLDGTFILEVPRSEEYGPVTTSPNWSADDKATRLFGEVKEIKSVLDELSKLEAELKNKTARDAWKAKENELLQDRERMFAEVEKSGRPPSPLSASRSRRTRVAGAA